MSPNNDNSNNNDEAWRRADGEAPSEHRPPDTSSTDTTDTTDPSLLSHASSFLDDPAIRDAPREDKVKFLQSKGLKAQDIETLLERQQPARDTGTAPDLSDAGERAWVAPRPPAATPPASQPRDIPPIVTYPEFLAQPSQQPPLMTTRRVLNAAYMAGGLTATLYGLSKYIIAPMTQNLAESRHEFAIHAREHLTKLNEHLKDAASVDPSTKVTSNASVVADDVSEADSDPTELYHRDFGTQTSPMLSRRPSVSSDAGDQSAVQAHESRLKVLTSHLRELEATRSNDFASSDSLKTKLSDMTTYLSEISYQNPYYSGMGSFYASNYGLPRMKDGQVDQIDVLKNDIRAVKGVFLSARNFPAGGRSTAPLGRAGG